MPIILKIIPVAPVMENAYIVGWEEDGQCAVIDPGAEAERILREAEASKLTIKVILNTHGHADHTGAVAAIKDATDAKYMLHKEEVDLLKDSPGPALSIPGFLPPPDPDQLLSDGDSVEVGKLKLTIFHTPGHTPGGVCYYGHGLVFTGDTLFQFSVGRTRAVAQHAQLMEGIRSKLMVLPDETVVLPGHGPYSKIGVERKWNPFLKGQGLLY